MSKALENKIKLNDLKIVSVVSFGAIGDGVTDNTSAFQNAINSVCTTGGILQIPNGTFILNGPLTIDDTLATLDPIEGDATRISIEGQGAGVTILKSTHAFPLFTYKGGTGAGVHSFFLLKDVGLLGPDRLVGSIGFQMENSSYWEFERVNIDKFEYGFIGFDSLLGSYNKGRVVANTHGFYFNRGSNDSAYSSVSLLLHGNGTDESTIFTDNSPTPKVVSYFGGVKIDSAQRKFGSGSINFTGTSSKLQVPHSTAFDFITGNWTIESWVYLTNVTSSTKDVLFCKKATAGSTNSVQLERVASANQLKFTASADGTTAAVTLNTTTGHLTNNTWHHVAVTRSGTEFVVWIDGQIRANTTSSISIASASSFPLTLGAEPDGTNNWKGYVDEFRITSGVARYTIAVGAFAVPTEEYPNQSAATSGGFQSFPNAITMNNVYISGSRKYGINVIGGSSFNFVNGTIEGNGIDSGTTYLTSECYGIRIENAGYEGRLGLNVTGSYFEGNGGQADIWVIQTIGGACHNISGNTFLRYIPTQYTQTCIQYDNSASTLSSRVVVAGNGFGAGEVLAGPYPISSTRPYVGASIGKIINAGNFFQNEIEVSREIFVNESISVITPDVNTTVGLYTNSATMLYLGTLTAQRDVTLAKAGAVIGTKVSINRLGAGAFALRIFSEGAATPLTALWPGSNAEFLFDGTDWLYSGSTTFFTGSPSFSSVNANRATEFDFGTTTTTVPFTTEVFDTLSEYDATTGIFTAKYAGTYLVTSTLSTNSFAWQSGKQFNSRILKNGTAYAIGTRDYKTSTTIASAASIVSSLVSCAAGDTLAIAAASDRTPDADLNKLSASGISNYLSIVRVN